MTAVLTTREMREAEQRVIDGGVAVETLMERAGTAAAEAVWRFAGPLPTLVVCGPGNNGGDGYVIARVLRERGVTVRVAALAPPASPAARSAHALWSGEVEPLASAAGAPLLVDALFGTGLARPLAPEAVAAMDRLGAAAQVRIAIDLPSGVATDDGAILSPVVDYDLTITFGAFKPAHLLQPAARHVGRLVLADIGIDACSALSRIDRPSLAMPGPDDHKYRRGFVAVLGGVMPGAAGLAAHAAARSGAGYVRLIGDRPQGGLPHAIVQGGKADLADARIGALVVGPGLGRGNAAAGRLEAALASGRPLVLDAEALALLADGALPALSALGTLPILTPHAGEFGRLFGGIAGNKVERTRAAARRAAAIVVHKGPDTVVAAPDGRAAIAPSAPAWLASAGTGDVLSGVIAAMRARGLAPFEAACAGVWIHGRAAERAGAGLIADDLLPCLPAVLDQCR